mgnify:CR=1 FL=1
MKITDLKTYTVLPNTTTTVPQKEQPKTFGQKAMDVGTGVSNFIGAKGITEQFGADIASATAKPEAKRFVEYPKMKEVEMIAGMVLAIEPMVNVGHQAIKTGADGWSVTTADEKLCAHFEHTVVVTEKGCDILTLP